MQKTGTLNKIAIMRAFVQGHKIEYRQTISGATWKAISGFYEPNWDWHHCEYRVAARPALTQVA